MNTLGAESLTMYSISDGGQPIVDRNGDEAGHLACGVDLDIGVGILRQDRHAMLPPHTHAIQRVGEPIDPGALLAVAKAAPIIDQRRAGAKLAALISTRSPRVSTPEFSSINASRSRSTKLTASLG